MPKVSEQHRIEKHDDILEAALRAFTRKGFQATSMAEIIAESGMSAGAIYGYFTSKAEIMRDVAMRVVTARTADLDILSQQESMPDPAVMVRTVISGILESHTVPSIQTQVWGEAVTDPAMRVICQEILTKVRVSFTNYLTRWQVQAHGLSERDAAQIATDQAPLFISAVHGFVIQDSLSPGFDRVAYLERTLPYLPR